MTTPQSAWQAPPVEAGPAPGVEFGGYGARLVAFIIDVIIVSVVTTLLIVIGTIVLFATSSFTVDASGTVTDGSIGAGGVTVFLFSFVLASAFGILYLPWFWARGGQTPGMRICGIRVVDDRDGSRIGWGKALLRLLGWVISAAVFYIGFIWMFVDGRRRGWQDLIGGTVVIKH